MSDEESDIEEINTNLQPHSISIEYNRKIISQLENCICMIYPKKGGTGTGFFCKFQFNLSFIKVLVTNNHVLNEEEIKDNNTIELVIYDKNLKKEISTKIKIDNSRYRYSNPDKEVDITFIEIKEQDNIKDFLDIDEELFDLNDNDLIEKKLRKKSVYILHYPDKKKISYGLIGDMQKGKKIFHYCDTQNGSSGSPILTLDSLKVIGVHRRGGGGNFKYNLGTNIKYAKDEFEKKYEINLIYEVCSEGTYNIFGTNFVKKNKDNIDIIINEANTNLMSSYKLNKGKNAILIKLKNWVDSLEYMFFNCIAPTDLGGLKNLAKKVINFSYMFCLCHISNIDSLKNWDVYNGERFENMFSKCCFLSNIDGLENWNVSNAITFKGMFSGCESLQNLNPLRNWKVGNACNFSYMFFGCKEIEDLSSLKNWDVSKAECCEEMFYGCDLLNSLKGLENWNFKKVNCLRSMFSSCKSLSNISALKNWNVSSVKNFNGMFQNCSSLNYIDNIQNWDISNGSDFSFMFENCKISNTYHLEKWKVQK